MVVFRWAFLEVLNQFRGNSKDSRNPEATPRKTHRMSGTQGRGRIESLDMPVQSSVIPFLTLQKNRAQKFIVEANTYFWDHLKPPPPRAMKPEECPISGQTLNGSPVVPDVIRRYLGFTPPPIQNPGSERGRKLTAENDSTVKLVMITYQSWILFIIIKSY